jgi:hypothetical protein|tara:strand:+ start:369 stop:569 length:201 start_codon:yes stop_codon:yes gene_type:complete
MVVKYAIELDIEKDYFCAYIWLYTINNIDAPEALKYVCNKLSEGQVSKAGLLVTEFSRDYKTVTKD